MSAPNTAHAALGALALALVIAAPAPGAAAEAPGAGAADDQDTSFTVGELVVTAIPYGAAADSHIFTSVDRLSPKVIERQNVDNTWELFGRLPGVLLTDFNQGTSSGRFSMRAFNGEGEINAVKLLIDGVPANTNDGAMAHLDMVFPLEIASLETVRGTLDPRYGLNNIAGSAAIATRTGGTYLESRLGYGAWSTREAQVAAGHETGAFSQNLMLAWRAADGYRDHASLDRKSLAAKFTYDAPGGGARVSAIARYYAADAQEPGYLTRADAAATPSASYAISATDGGDRKLREAALTYAGTPLAGVSANAVVYVNTFDDSRFIRFSAGVSQQERIAREDQWGASGALRWEAPAGPLYALTFETGADLQRQDVISQRYLTQARVRTRQTRDQAYTLDSQGGFLQAVIEPTATLKLVPGYRLDWVDGRYHDRATGVRADAYDYGAIRQPKVSAVWTPRPDLMVYGNWGRTFQVGVGSGAYKIPPRQLELKPSLNDGWEVGVKHTYADRLQARLAYWEQTATGEVKRKLNDPLGDSENLGRTKRRGVDLQVSYDVTADWSLWAAVTYQRATIKTPDPTQPAARGQSIDHVPNQLLAGGADWQATDKLQLSLTANAQDDYYLEPTNTTGKFGGYVLVNLEATYALSRRTELQVQLKNLGDHSHAYVWWDGVQTLHSPGDPRSLHAALTLRF